MLRLSRRLPTAALGGSYAPSRTDLLRRMAPASDLSMASTRAMPCARMCSTKAEGAAATANAANSPNPPKPNQEAPKPPTGQGVPKEAPQSAPNAGAPKAETSKASSSTTSERASQAPRTPSPSRAAEMGRQLFSSWQRGLAATLGIATGIGLLVFFLAAPMKADTVQQTAQIASQALEDQRLKETATRLSKEVVEQILTDPRSVVLLADVINTLLKQDSSKLAVTSFIREIFEDKYTQEVTKKFVLKVVSDPWVMDQLHHILFNLVDDLLKDPETKDALREVLVTSSIEALKDEAFQAQGGRAVRSIVWQTIWNSKASTSTEGTPTAGK